MNQYISGSWSKLRCLLPHRCFNVGTIRHCHKTYLHLLKTNTFTTARSNGQNFLRSKHISGTKGCLSHVSYRTLSSGSNEKEKDNTAASDEEELISSLKKDPEIKNLLKEFQSDFGYSDSQPDQSVKDDSTKNEQSSSSGAVNEKVLTATEEAQDDDIIDLSEYAEDMEDKVTPSSDKVEDYYKAQEKILEAELEQKYYEDAEDIVEYEPPERQIPISMERGMMGVYDIEDLVTLLQSENAIDMCVIRLPQQLNYVDHMVILTGRSFRHLKAMADNIKWLYKKKRRRGDPHSVKIEGLGSRDWLALDLGNIAVHLFLAPTREKYDLETLWTVGEDFDKKSLEEQTSAFDSLLTEDLMLHLGSGDLSQFKLDSQGYPEGGTDHSNLEGKRQLSDSYPDKEYPVDWLSDPNVPQNKKDASQEFRQKSMESWADWHGDRKK